MLITVSRQLASFGNEIAASLSQKLGYALITRSELFRLLPDLSAHEQRMLSESAKFWLQQKDGDNLPIESHYSPGTPYTYTALLSRAVREFSQHDSAILAGYGSALMFAEIPDALHIRVTAPMDVRISRIKKRYSVSAAEAQNIILKADRKQARFVRTVFDADIYDNSLYGAVFNTALLSVDECVSAVTALARAKELTMHMHESSGPVVCNTSDVPVFKNEAEAEFAKLLDMYNIEWKYEPKTFPLEWDSEGNVTKAMSPDFYLTMFDTYIEITAMDQRYVTEKNRKLKRLRELYPGTNIRIVYKKDFNSLAERFGLGREV